MVLRRITTDNSVRYFPKKNKRKKLNKTRQKIKNIVKKFNLFPEEVNQTKNFQKIIKNLLKILQQEDLEYLQYSMYIYKNIYIIICI